MRPEVLDTVQIVLGLERCDQHLFNILRDPIPVDDLYQGGWCRDWFHAGFVDSSPHEIFHR